MSLEKPNFGQNYIDKEFTLHITEVLAHHEAMEGAGKVLARVMLFYLQPF